MIYKRKTIKFTVNQGVERVEEQAVVEVLVEAQEERYAPLLLQKHARPLICSVFEAQSRWSPDRTRIEGSSLFLISSFPFFILVVLSLLALPSDEVQAPPGFIFPIFLIKLDSGFPRSSFSTFDVSLMKTALMGDRKFVFLHFPKPTVLFEKPDGVGVVLPPARGEEGGDEGIKSGPGVHQFQGERDMSSRGRVRVYGEGPAHVVPAASQ